MSSLDSQDVGIDGPRLISLKRQPESFKQSVEELDLRGCDGVTDLGLTQLLPELERLLVLNLEDCPEVTSKMLETVKTYCPKPWYLLTDVDFSDQLDLLDALPLLEN
ncbi:uncharacterized protein LOC136039159 isoform X1 [Artemia franciscana]|uniref:uncharacterized protein LOC136039159 isoform X1 n=1 Tax=Artemia franciscana TaxID=6661 RepID=UPI0032DA9566